MAALAAVTHLVGTGAFHSIFCLLFAPTICFFINHTTLLAMSQNIPSPLWSGDCNRL
jgi:hypothetical protein